MWGLPNFWGLRRVPHNQKILAATVPDYTASYLSNFQCNVSSELEAESSMLL
jgi:hypothetical protein